MLDTCNVAVFGLMARVSAKGVTFGQWVKTGGTKLGRGGR
jgi:hypothetical protein